MDLSLNKLPWWGQLVAFVVVCALATGGFWYYYVVDAQAAIGQQETRLRTLKADVDKGMRTAWTLPEFQAQVADLERRLDTLRAVLPEQKDVGDVLRRVQGLASQSNVKIMKFTPQEPKPQQLYTSLPFKIEAEGRYHDLGAFFDRIRTFNRIIHVGEMTIRAKPNADPSGATILAECIVTTFVMQEMPPAKSGPGAPKPPGAK